MNRITREIVSQLLEQEWAWDKTTRELQHHKVVEMYHGVREFRFYDEIFFPRMSRAFKLIQALGILPPEHFQIVDMDGHEVLWIRDDLPCDCEWEIAQHFFGEFVYTPTGMMRSTYFSAIWENEDWAWEEPSEEEILSLGIRPHMVPDKVRHGTVQKSLF